MRTIVFVCVFGMCFGAVFVNYCVMVYGIVVFRVCVYDCVYCVCVIHVLCGVMFYGLGVVLLFTVCVCALLLLFNVFVSCGCD